ncbi:MAG TPA: M24 family metallopeptidase [Chloroflexota bacterium]
MIKRGGLYWDREALPPEIFEQRLKRVQAAIAESGDDAWVMYGDAQRYGPATYVSHFLPRTRSVLVLVPRSGQPALLASVGPRDVPAAKTLTAVEDVRPFVRLPREAIRLLVEFGLGQKQVGLVGAHAQLSVAEWEAISSELPEIQWQQRDDAFEQLRVAKAPEERAMIHRALEVARTGLDAAAEAIRRGQSVRQALAVVDKAMRYAGAEDLRLLAAVGNGSLRPASDVRLTGQSVSVLAEVEVQRYWAEAARTYHGSPALAEQALQAMVDAAKPGAAAGAVADAARGVLSSATGWTDTSADAYGLGHGIGLDLEERPAIEPGSRAALVSGSALALHVVLPGAIAGTTVLV